ncbi:MAG: tetratricopeptide repeat protein [Desulfobacterales bacterium]
MKRPLRLFCSFFILSMLVIMTAGICYAQLPAGQYAPLFSLKDVKGKIYDLSNMKSQPMVIIYFFDVDSRPSQEGLLSIDQLSKQYKDADLMVWGVTRSATSKVKKFIKTIRPSFPVLIDSSGVSDLYHARLILPTICILGPDLKLLDYFQGGGKTTEIMLVKLAERKLQRKQTKIARAISEKVVKKNPKNVKAKTVQGYAALKEGRLDEAEKTFYNLSRKKGEGEILGKEGLSTVYAKKGQTEKALNVTKEIEKKAANRAYPHVVKGNLLYRQNKVKEAESEYKKAIRKKEETYHSAVAYNQLGRIYAGRGDYKKSRELYDQAVAMDPYYIEATSNKGLTYEREGNWEKALEAYRNAQAVNPDDPFAAVLADKAQARLILEKDLEKKRVLNNKVKELVAKYNSGIREDVSGDDSWTSQPVILSFFDFMETGGLAERDGFVAVISAQLSRQLEASGRVQVVDSILIERLIKALGLNKKDLADKETTLRLARALDATLLVKGSVYYLPGGPLLKINMINIDTPEKSTVVTRQFSSDIRVKKDLHWLNREILTDIILHYPLQAYVVKVSGHQVLINLGLREGVVNGTIFNVIEEKAPVVYKGKSFQPEPSVMAQVHVVKIEPEFSYGHIKNQRRPIKPDDKLRENIDNISKIGDKTNIW